MRILYITLEDLSFHKGSVVHIKEIVRGLRNLGHRVGLVASTLDGTEEADHFYNLHRLSMFSSRRQPYLLSCFFLFVYLFKILPQYDVIYARDFHTVVIALLPRLIFKKKLAFEINGIANEEQKLRGDRVSNRAFAWIVRKAESMATKYSDRIVSVTPQIILYLEKNFNCHAEKARVIGNGVDTEKFHPIEDVGLIASWRERLGILQDDLVIVFVGNLAPWQGLPVLIDCAIRLLSKEKKIKFLIVGEGSLRKNLMKAVFNSGYEKRIVFTGMMPYQKIPFLINVADICVAPFIERRNRETGVSPLKIYEYMACGKPIIASRIEGLEFIETEGLGRLCHPENPISLEKALIELLNDSSERKSMGQKAFQMAHDRFSWASKVIEIDGLIKELA